MDHLQDIHNYVHQHLKLASDRTKTRYNWPPTRAAARVAKRSSIAQALILMGGPIQGYTRVNDVVYRIQLNPRSRMVVHLDWLAPIREPLRTSGLNQGVMGAVDE